MEIIRIGGFDPGLRFSGYGIVNYNSETREIWISNCGLIITPTKIKGLDAICYMRDSMEEVCSRECFSQCSDQVIEIPAAIYSKGFSAGGLLPTAVIGGCALSMFDKEKIVPVYPSVWNGGKKKAKTMQIIEDDLGNSTTWHYDDPPKRDSFYEHIYDAVGMAYWLLKKKYLED